jgi:transcriptional regulator with XRE-family HTH domain
MGAMDNKTKFAKALGRQLIAVRKAQGLERSEAARKAGITHNELLSYEAGIRVPRSDRLNGILKALGVEELEVF